ncbi:MAG: AAA family ATPase [Candidatus Omnitrophica bacterium]|nr:AAA family ATPase [Candidatus Omnitrophota bacterium]
MKAYIEAWEKIFGFKGAKRIFIAATRQNVGKTTISLGLISNLKDRFTNIGFIKPVGQRYLVEGGHKIDEDAVLMDRIFGFGMSLRDMSPVAVERGYTERFIDGLAAHDASGEIKRAFGRVSSGKDIVIIEGTGHAGVGSVFDLSNAAVAKLLGSKVILISSGGVGKPIDEVMLNKSLFDKLGVRLAGVIVNKVMTHKYEKVNRYVRAGLERLGVPVLGVVPYIDTLDTPSMRDIKEVLDMHVISGEKHMDRQMKRILVGAMEVRDAVQYLEEDCVVITPGNRVDLINLLIRVHTGRFRAPRRIAGLILSGGITPPRRIFNALRKTTIPTIICRYDTYDVASKIHDLTVKIKSRDKNKIRLVVDMVRRYVDIDAVVSSLS